jgi:hypothetical protein
MNKISTPDGDREMTPEEVAAFEAERPVPVVLPRLVPKNDIYDRMTDPECTLFEAALAALPARQRLLWTGATAIDVEREDVRAAFTAAVGAQRAAAILDGAA